MLEVSVPFGDSIYLNYKIMKHETMGYACFRPLRGLYISKSYVPTLKNPVTVSVPFGDSIYLNIEKQSMMCTSRMFPSPSGTLYI